MALGTFFIKWSDVRIQINYGANLILCLAKASHHLSIKSGQPWLLPDLTHGRSHLSPSTQRQAKPEEIPVAHI